MRGRRRGRADNGMRGEGEGERGGSDLADDVGDGGGALLSHQ